MVDSSVSTPSSSLTSKPSSSSSSSSFHSFMSWWVRPNPNVHYHGIAVIYTLFSIIALLFYGWEQYWTSQPQTEWEASWNGTYLVLLPYIPGLIWILIIMAYSRTFPPPLLHQHPQQLDTSPVLSSKDKDKAA